MAKPASRKSPAGPLCTDKSKMPIKNIVGRAQIGILRLTFFFNQFIPLFIFIINKSNELFELSRHDFLYDTGLEIRIWKWAVKWPPTFRYGRSLWSFGRSLIYGKKNIRILMFENSEKNTKVDKCLIRINSNTRTQMIYIVLNFNICKFYLF